MPMRLNFAEVAPVTDQVISVITGFLPGDDTIAAPGLVTFFTVPAHQTCTLTVLAAEGTFTAFKTTAAAMADVVAEVATRALTEGGALLLTVLRVPSRVCLVADPGVGGVGFTKTFALFLSVARSDSVVACTAA